MSNFKLPLTNFRRYLIGSAVTIFLLAVATSGAVVDRLFGLKFLDYLIPNQTQEVNQRIVKEESAVVDVVEAVSPSVVTVSIETPARRILEFSPFGGLQSRIEGGSPQDIGTGFVVDVGLVVTNKHVVSTTGASYKVVDKEGREYPVEQINRDPANDIAILQINADLPALELGDSSNLKVGQFVIAIGTALGEFRETVTTGVISGLGRGITAGSPFEGYVEAENIGFAIPINLVQQRLTEFKTTGKFEPRAFLGVSYQLISQQSALLNNVPQGAYVVEVAADSAAAKAGIAAGDIITKFSGLEIHEGSDLSDAITAKKVGDEVEVEIFRDGKNTTIKVTLAASPE